MVADPTLVLPTIAGCHFKLQLNDAFLLETASYFSLGGHERNRLERGNSNIKKWSASNLKLGTLNYEWTPKSLLEPK